MIEISDKFNQNIFYQIINLWEMTGVGNPARGDDLTSINRTLTNGGKIFTLYYNADLVGTCWITHDFRRCYIHHMAVHPDFQNKGYGKILLENALNYCKKLGMQAKLEVHTNNPIAQKLYQNFGFKLLDGYEVYIKRDINNN